jgi:hypothetical protein
MFTVEVILSAGTDFAPGSDLGCTRFHKVGAGFGETASCKVRLAAMFLLGNQDLQKSPTAPCSAGKRESVAMPKFAQYTFEAK